MVLLFLGSWRSTLIVLTSIPLALLCSIIGLNLAGATFNLMTLGGLALAIGILVDNALVEIENIKRQMSLGKDVRTAILDGAREVAFPEFVSTISICIVFLPIFLLTRNGGGRLPPARARGRLRDARELPAGPHARADARVDHPARRDCGPNERMGHSAPRGLARVHHARSSTALDRLIEVQRRRSFDSFCAGNS